VRRGRRDIQLTVRSPCLQLFDGATDPTEEVMARVNLNLHSMARPQPVHGPEVELQCDRTGFCSGTVYSLIFFITTKGGGYM
jgi:hypothetical protein